MWIYEYIPLWTLNLLLAAAGLALALSYTKLLWLYKLPVRYVSISILVVGLYMCGAKTMNNHWHQRASDLQAQVEALQAKSGIVNTQIVTKIQERNVAIAQNTEETIRYIDREITKFDVDCTLPQELIEVHNRAAKQ